MPETTTLYVMVVDPSTIFYDGIRNSLSQGGHVALPQARNRTEALRQLADFHPSLALIGPNLAEDDSLAVCRALTARAPGMKVIVFTPLADDPHFQADAVDAGAAACLPPVNGANTLLAAMRDVLAGRLLFPREILAPAFQHLEFTAKELEMLRLMAEGKSDPQIAQAMTVSVSTVHSHRQHIFEKLDVHDRRDAVRRARRRGLV